MKLNWFEKWVVNNPLRVLEQKFQIHWFKTAMPLKPAADILEIGCGRGAGAGLIYKNFSPAFLAAQDLDPDMVQRAQRYLSLSDDSAISLSVADATRIPFKDMTFDATFGFGFLHHVPMWQKALEEISRILKPGGFYYIEELYPALYQNFITKRILVHPRQNRFVSRDLKAALNQVGLNFKSALECRCLGILGVAAKEV